ncbi:MAG: DNA repair protein [Actinobacteria bacterium]|nr:DNA repair protein [Actinomycetota bacterium]
MPEALYFTDSDEANELIAQDPLALLIGFALDQQVTVPTAFSGPLKLKQRLGEELDPAKIVAIDPAELEELFRQRPAIHRFPGAMARRVQELCAVILEDYGGDAERVWTEATDAADLARRIGALPGFGVMKISGLGSVLALRFGLETAAELVPSYPNLGRIDSKESLAEYQAAKRAHKAELRAAAQAATTA